jgi:hypothetical protein
VLKGMWGGSITRGYLLQKISLLAMLGSVQEVLKEHDLVPRSDRTSSLTVEQEGEIVSDLAFLSSCNKDAKSVIAIGIEEDRDGQGTVVHMVGDSITYLKEGLTQIGVIFERDSRLGKANPSGLSPNLVGRAIEDKST